MNDLAERIASLTPDQRALLLRRLGLEDRARPAAGPADLIPRLPRDGRPLEASVAQEDLWLVDHLDPGNPANNVAYPVRLLGPLDVDALDRALAEVVRRHEALRTVFAAREGRPVQRVAEAPAAPLLRHDLSALPPAAREAELAARVAAEQRHRFVLGEGPLLRVSLFRLGAEEHGLVVLLHHIVMDGWSLGILFRELAALYGAFTGGAPSPLPPPALHFADWAAWQRAQFAGPRGEALLAYWRGALEGAPAVLDLPTDRPRAHGLFRAGGWFRFQLAPEPARALRALARREGATPFMVLLALFDVLLLRWSGQSDLLVGTAVANRARVEVEEVFGYFINTLVVRARLGGDPSFREALGRVREAVSGAFAHQELPFETMARAVEVEIRPGYHPLFQVLFLYQNATGDLALPGLRTELLETDRSAAEFDLTLTTSDLDDGGIRCGFEYAADLFDEATVRRMAEHLGRLAASVAADPDAPVSALPMLEPGEAPPSARPRPAPVVLPSAHAPLPALRPSAAAREATVAARWAEALSAEGAAGDDSLSSLSPARLARVVDRVRAEAPGRAAAFVFPGPDALIGGGWRALYAAEPVFRAEVDRCAELLAPHLGIDVREVDEVVEMDEAGWPVWTEAPEPTAFVVGHALAALWRSWGVRPAAVMGEGVGEVAAACAAGVFPLDDALALVAARARELRAIEGGGRLRVPLPADGVAPFLPPGAAVAEVDATDGCVVAGPRSDVAEAERRLREAGHATRRLPATHPFGAPLAKLATARLEGRFYELRRGAPTLPIVSTVTGAWMDSAQATAPRTWVRHHRDTVRLDGGVRALLEAGVQVFVALGPAGALESLVGALSEGEGAVVASLPGADGGAAAHLARAVRDLARAGVTFASFDEATEADREREGAEAGVLDLAALAAPPASEPVSTGRDADDDRPSFEPSSQVPDDVRERLGGLWRELLGVEPKPTDDFFLLGGHSLMASQLLARVHDVFGVELPLQAVFMARDLTALAGFVEDALAGGLGGALSEVEAMGLV